MEALCDRLESEQFKLTENDIKEIYLLLIEFIDSSMNETIRNRLIRKFDISIIHSFIDSINSQNSNNLKKFLLKRIKPELITLSDVADILQRKGTLPGIDTSIDSEPLSDSSVLTESAQTRPVKPWEVH